MQVNMLTGNRYVACDLLHLFDMSRPYLRLSLGQPIGPPVVQTFNMRTSYGKKDTTDIHIAKVFRLEQGRLHTGPDLGIVNDFPLSHTSRASLSQS